jgi:hypothetical protein
VWFTTRRIRIVSIGRITSAIVAMMVFLSTVTGTVTVMVMAFATARIGARTTRHATESAKIPASI